MVLYIGLNNIIEEFPFFPFYGYYFQEYFSIIFYKLINNGSYNNFNPLDLNITFKVFKVFKVLKSSFIKLIIPSDFINNYNNNNNTNPYLLVFISNKNFHLF